ncbi:hypothetical protein BKA59DRAFT_455798 [Fusarium tricinctum]|uniref:Alcohol dehydrogenase-like C-terminal domain-containing protein n=1 Tax=Fusarium tricinctum TaxID=61284 RepID=A0A8K0WCC9_9HYPO|nr:hypothetical protein BKA59DRAFT_455798 [Fusarium tricinctum]
MLCYVYFSSGGPQLDKDHAEYSIVVLIGCGPVGISALIAALEYKPKAILAVDGIESRLSLAKILGAEPWNYLTQKDDIERQVKELSDGRGADVIIEVVGHSSALDMGFKLLRPWGIVSTVGVHNERSHGSATKLTERILPLRWEDVQFELYNSDHNATE